MLFFTCFCLPYSIQSGQHSVKFGQSEGNRVNLPFSCVLYICRKLKLCVKMSLPDCQVFLWTQSLFRYICDKIFYKSCACTLCIHKAIHLSENQAYLTLRLLMSSADNLCKQFGPRQNVGPDLDSNCLTLWWYS